MYTALYRKLRPTTFADIVGQEHIVKTLTNQIITERISHAYLFCGTRGTGKTSCAKVFAKAVNCENPQNGEACGLCSSCEGLASGASLDVIEIDAASNNGVDNIRELREEVRYPASGKYKVYIIDEVHMLSTGAFNALLKTLEEPPPHVIFILATTDPQKIPATIHSRLMRFDFHRISMEHMTKALRKYVNEEGIIITNDALTYVARLSDGSMRDALSLLDRCASLYFGQEITLEGALEITGSVDNSVFFETIQALLNKDARQCLDIIEELSAKGRDFGQFSDEMLVHLRNILVAAAGVKSGEKYDEIAAKSGYDEIIRMIAAFSGISRTIRQSGGNAKLALEVGCIEFVTEVRGQRSEVREPDIKQNFNKEVKTEIVKEEVKKKAIPDDVRKVLLEWNGFIREFEPNFAPFMQKTQPGFLEDEYLYIVCPDLFVESHLRKRTEYIEDKLRTKYGLEFSVNIIAKNFYDERHRRKYNLVDDFNYTAQGENADIDRLKKMIDFEIEES